MAGDPRLENEAVSKAFSGLNEGLSNLRSTGKGAETVLKELSRAISDQKDAAARAKSPMDGMTKILQIIQAQSKNSTDALAKYTNALKTNMDVVRDTADDMASQQGLITDEVRKKYEAEVGGLRAAISLIDKKGATDLADQARIGAMGNTIRAKELENFKSRMETEVAWGKSLQMNGDLVDRVKGGMIGLTAKMREHGAVAAEAVGGVLGQTGEQMMGLAGVLGPMALLLPLLIKGVTKGFQDAQEAMGAGFGGMGGTTGQLGTGQAYKVRISEALGAGGLSKTLTNELSQGIASARGEYGFALSETGGDFLRNISIQSNEARADMRMAAIDVAADVMLIGKAYGVASSDSIKYASAMASMANPSSNNGVTHSFMAITESANAIGLPVGKLIATMSEMGDVAAISGMSLEETTAQTRGFYRVVQDAAKSGDIMFKNMSAERMQSLAQGMAKGIAGISEGTLMALNMTPGESFEQSLNALKGGNGMPGLGSMSGREASIKKFIATYAAGSGAMNDFIVGHTLLGIQSESQAMAMGKLLKDTSAKGGSITEEYMKSLQSNSINNTINTAKNVGENIAMGADPMELIAGFLEKILRLIEGHWGPGGDKGSSAKAPGAMAPPHPVAYRRAIPMHTGARS